jgi:ribosomal protein S11
MAGLCALFLAGISPVRAQSDPPPDAERIARIYMTAFFAGDFRTAAEAMDPKTLDRIRESFLSDLIKISDPEAEKAVLANLGIAGTAADAGKVDPKTLYAAITAADRRRNPQLFEAMKRSRVEVLGSEPNPAGGVTVYLRVFAPAGSEPPTQDLKLLVRQVLGDWKVAGNAP